MTFPTPYTVTRAAHTTGAINAHGNTVDTWTAPASVLVHGWAPPSGDREPDASGRNAVERDLDLYAPAGTPGGPRDLWVVDGDPYTQVGHSEDYTRGPWAMPGAGLRINLQRIEG